jgi:hypothetical protein
MKGVFGNEGAFLFLGRSATNNRWFHGILLGSARVSRVGFGVLAETNFPLDVAIGREVREPETASPARETHALPKAIVETHE